MGPRRNHLIWLSLVGLALCFAPSISRWWALGFLTLPFVALGLWRRIDPPPPPQRVTLDGEGVTRELRGGKTERVSWKELIEVSVLTTSDGPFGDDFFWMLRGRDGGGCLVPGPLAGDLMGRLQRLPRFDNEQAVRAAGSTTEAHFLCWKGEAGEGLVAAEPAPTISAARTEPRVAPS